MITRGDFGSERLERPSHHIIRPVSALIARHTRHERGHEYLRLSEEPWLEWTRRKGLLPAVFAQTHGRDVFTNIRPPDASAVDIEDRFQAIAKVLDLRPRTITQVFSLEAVPPAFIALFAANIRLSAPLKRPRDIGAVTPHEHISVHLQPIIALSSQGFVQLPLHETGVSETGKLALPAAVLV